MQYDATVTWPEDDPASEPRLICTGCGEVLCTIEHGDYVDTYAELVSEHNAEAHADRA